MLTRGHIHDRRTLGLGENRPTAAKTKDSVAGVACLGNHRRYLAPDGKDFRPDTRKQESEAQKLQRCAFSQFRVE